MHWKMVRNRNAWFVDLWAPNGVHVALNSSLDAYCIAATKLSLDSYRMAETCSVWLCQSQIKTPAVRSSGRQIPRIKRHFGGFLVFHFLHCFLVVSSQIPANQKAHPLSPFLSFSFHAHGRPELAGNSLGLASHSHTLEAKEGTV